MNDGIAMQRAELARRIADASTLKGEFTLRSGQVSNLYFDKYRFEGTPALLKPLARAMAELVPDGTEILAGLELGGVPLVTAISLERASRRRLFASRPRHTGPVARSRVRTSPAAASPSLKM